MKNLKFRVFSCFLGVSILLSSVTSYSIWPFSSKPETPVSSNKSMLIVGGVSLVAFLACSAFFIKKYFFTKPDDSDSKSGTPANKQRKTGYVSYTQRVKDSQEQLREAEKMLHEANEREKKVDEYEEKIDKKIRKLEKDKKLALQEQKLRLEERQESLAKLKIETERLKKELARREKLKKERLELACIGREQERVRLNKEIERVKDDEHVFKEELKELKRKEELKKERLELARIGQEQERVRLDKEIERVKDDEHVFKEELKELKRKEKFVNKLEGDQVDEDIIIISGDTKRPMKVSKKLLIQQSEFLKKEMGKGNTRIELSFDEDVLSKMFYLMWRAYKIRETLDEDSSYFDKDLKDKLELEINQLGLKKAGEKKIHSLLGAAMYLRVPDVGDALENLIQADRLLAGMRKLEKTGGARKMTSEEKKAKRQKVIQAKKVAHPRSQSLFQKTEDF